MLTFEDLKAASTLCVHFVDQTEADALNLQVRDSDIIVFHVDGSGVSTAEELFHRLAQSMSFPDYFGMNWDGLDEVLDDFSWLPGTGYVLMLSGAETLWKGAPRVAGAFVSSWLNAADEWSYDGVPFHLIFVW